MVFGQIVNDRIKLVLQRIYNPLTLFVSVVVLFCNQNAFCRSIVLTPKRDLNSQVIEANVTYIIKWCFDLKGQEVKVPPQCTLYFKGGVLRNGTIVGSETRVKSDKKRVFESIEIRGKWNNEKVYSEWLDFVEGRSFDNAFNFHNLMTLCNGRSLTHLFMQKGVFYCSVKSNSSYIKIPSNVYWHNRATIRQLPTDIPKYSLVLLQNSNHVTIDGGVFVGDVLKHIGDKGEWGHGIKIAGANNVVLKNLTCREFWGDGIDIIEGRYNAKTFAGEGICSNITVDSVKCLYNRRQGISIEAGKDVLVKNSEFAYTGKYKMTEPGCGVDIEPWCRNEKKIDNIRFFNCFIHDNNPKRDFCVEANIQYDNMKKKASHYNFAHNIIMKDCKIKELSRLRVPRGLKLERCLE